MKGLRVFESFLSIQFTLDMPWINAKPADCLVVQQQYKAPFDLGVAVGQTHNKPRDVVEFGIQSVS